MPQQMKTAIAILGLKFIPDGPSVYGHNDHVPQRVWLRSLAHVPALADLGARVMTLGRIAGRKECWPLFESFYWSFITATTVAYGDICPLEQTSRILAIIIAVMGLKFTSIVIAVAVHAATFALATHDAAARVR
jgi:hypothetical protein